MPSIIYLEEIKLLLQQVDVVAAMETGFIQYSRGNTVVPPVGELIFEQPPGDVHIKYGYIKNEDYYVIKIASGFYENPLLSIASGQGLMLLFNQKTGQLLGVLLDNGHLTDIRTAAAGALAAKYFAPKKVKAIGIIGTGMQAKLQLQYLQKSHPNEEAYKEVWLWGRNAKNVQKFKKELGKQFNIQIASTPDEVAQNTNLIVTTTPSEKPLLQAASIQKGTLITAVGSDTAHKQELDSQILKEADLVIADSLPQSKSRGEIYQAVKARVLSEIQIHELGAAIENPDLHRSSEEQNIVVDLTGVAVQDIMIATAVYLNYQNSNK